MTSLIVNAFWDDEARVWVAESDDVPGLATGAETLEELLERLEIVIPELLELNAPEAAHGEVQFSLNVQRSLHLAA